MQFGNLAFGHGDWAPELIPDLVNLAPEETCTPESEQSTSETALADRGMGLADGGFPDPEDRPAGDQVESTDTEAASIPTDAEIGEKETAP